MPHLNSEYAEDYSYDEKVVTVAHAEEYAAEVAKAAINKYIATKDNSMEQSGINTAAQQVMAETQLNAKLIGGEILLENIETLATNLILNRIPWYKRLMVSAKNKELAITVTIYAIVHAIKTGGFGLTSYRVNHAALDYITIAANARLLKFIQKTVGVDTNIAAMLMKAPTVEIA